MRSSKPLRLFRVWDVLLLVILVVLVGLTVWFSIARENGDCAEVYVNGKKYTTLPLNKDAEISLEHLIIVVSGGKVSVKDADCPDKICERRGAIRKKGESIVCLPNRVVIKIAGKGEVEAIT